MSDYWPPPYAPSLTSHYRNEGHQYVQMYPNLQDTDISRSGPLANGNPQWSSNPAMPTTRPISPDPPRDHPPPYSPTDPNPNSGPWINPTNMQLNNRTNAQWNVPTNTQWTNPTNAQWTNPTNVQWRGAPVTNTQSLEAQQFRQENLMLQNEIEQLQQQLRQQSFRGANNGMAEYQQLHSEVAQLTQENDRLQKELSGAQSQMSLLQHSLKTHGEDFEQERRDRVRIHEEKEKLQQELEKNQAHIEMLYKEGCREMEDHDHLGYDDHLDYDDHLGYNDHLDYNDHLGYDDHLDYNDHWGEYEEDDVPPSLPYLTFHTIQPTPLATRPRRDGERRNLQAYRTEGLQAPPLPRHTSSSGVGAGRGPLLLLPQQQPSAHTPQLRLSPSRFTRPQSTRVHTSADVFAVQKNWFVDIDRDGSDHLLKNAKDGTFLVRPTQSAKVQHHVYTVDIKYAGIRHLRVLKIKRKYGFSSPCVFESLRDLIVHYSKNQLTEHNPVLTTTLKFPVNTIHR